MAISNVSSGLRPGICTSTTRPQSPYNGFVIYETDTKQTLVWQGSAWVMLTDADSPPGLQLVKTQTVGTTVSNVTVTDAFNADYENYRIIISGVTTSASTEIIFQFVDASNNTVTTNYAAAGYFQSGSGTLNGDYSLALSSWGCAYGTANQRVSASFDLLNPNLAHYSYIPVIQFFGSTVAVNRSGYHASATAYPSFKISCLSGTMTGGTIRIYGYRN